MDNKYRIKLGFDFSSLLPVSKKDDFDYRLNKVFDKKEKIVEIMNKLKRPICEYRTDDISEKESKELVKVVLVISKDTPVFIEVLVDIQYKEIFDYICCLIANPEDCRSTKNPLIVENLINVTDGEEIYEIQENLNYDLTDESFNAEIFKNKFERRFVLLSNLFWKSKEITL